MFLLFPKINAYGVTLQKASPPCFCLLHAFNETTINTKLGANLKICSLAKNRVILQFYKTEA